MAPTHGVLKEVEVGCRCQQEGSRHFGMGLVGYRRGDAVHAGEVVPCGRTAATEGEYVRRVCALMERGRKERVEVDAAESDIVAARDGYGSHLGCGWVQQRHTSSRDAGLRGMPLHVVDSDKL